MRRLLFLSLIVSSIDSFAQLQSSGEICNSLKKIATSDWEYGDYHIEELGKISWTKSMSDWTDSEIESLKDLALSCNTSGKWNVDSAYLTDLTKRNIQALKTKLPAWKSKHDSSANVKSELESIANQVGPIDKPAKIGDEKELIEAKNKLQGVSVKPSSSDYMRFVQISGLIDEKLRHIEQIKLENRSAQDEKEFKNQQIAEENKVKTKLLEVQKSDPKKFQACEKQKQKMVSLVEKLAKSKKSVDQAASQRKQTEVLKEMEKTTYEVDQLKEKMESDGCSKFYITN